jgi:hypothetical protein
MAKGDPISSPWTYEQPDIHGLKIRATFSFDNVTRALTGLVVYRDPGCLKTTIYLGVGPDGLVESTGANNTFVVPDGTTNITANQMRQRGFNTIEDALAAQITCGP